MTDAEILLRLVRERRSVRRFRPEPIPREQIEKVLEAGRWAPSAGNRQAYRLLVVRNRQTLHAMAAAVERMTREIRAELPEERVSEAGMYLDSFTLFDRASLALVPIHRSRDVLRAGLGTAEGKLHRASRDAFDMVCSVSAVITNMLLMAHSLGLGACWMTGPLIAAEQIAELLAVPAGWTPSAVVPIGFPDEEPDAPPRRSRDRLVTEID